MKIVYNGILKKFSLKRHFYLPLENGQGLPITSQKSYTKDDDLEITSEDMAKGEFYKQSYVVCKAYEAKGGKTGKAVTDSFFEKCLDKFKNGD